MNRSLKQLLDMGFKVSDLLCIFMQLMRVNLIWELENILFEICTGFQMYFQGVELYKVQTILIVSAEMVSFYHYVSYFAQQEDAEKALKANHMNIESAIGMILSYYFIIGSLLM